MSVGVPVVNYITDMLPSRLTVFYFSLSLVKGAYQTAGVWFFLQKTTHRGDVDRWTLVIYLG